MDTARTVEKHERVGRALEQINGLRYRYHAPAKKAKEQLTFDSDDDEDGRKSDSDGDGDEGGEDSSSLSLDEHIEHILRKTRTIALLKIANNTAEIVSPDDEIEEEDDEFEGDYCETIEEDEDDEKQEEAKSVGPRTGSFRKLASMRKPSGVFHLEETEESAAAQRLARKLSTYLCLPRVISYRDLEAITETLLDERRDESEEYADMIDYHVDSARDSSSAGDGGAMLEDGSEAPIWKRRQSRPVGPLDVPDDPVDLEMHQRRLFMEANQFGRFSSRNFFTASSRSLLNKQSMKRLESSGSLHLSTSGSAGEMTTTMLKKGSMRSVGSQESRHSLNGATVAEEDDSGGEDTDEILLQHPTGPNGERGSIFLEEDYVKWRTEIKEDYLAWINAKVEAAKRRKSRAKKEAGKKPRWLLLYEASKRRPARDEQDAK